MILTKYWNISSLSSLYLQPKGSIERVKGDSILEEECLTLIRCHRFSLQYNSISSAVAGTLSKLASPAFDLPVLSQCCGFGKVKESYESQTHLISCVCRCSCAVIKNAPSNTFKQSSESPRKATIGIKVCVWSFRNWKKLQAKPVSKLHNLLFMMVDVPTVVSVK